MCKIYSQTTSKQSNNKKPISSSFSILGFLNWSLGSSILLSNQLFQLGNQPLDLRNMSDIVNSTFNPCDNESTSTFNFTTDTFNSALYSLDTIPDNFIALVADLNNKAGDIALDGFPQFLDFFRVLDVFF